MPQFTNKIVEYDGHTFGSMEEKRFYDSLKRRADVREIKTQVKFLLQEGYSISRGGKDTNVREVSYVADFVVIYENGEQEVIDVKATNAYETDVFKLKRKMFEHRYRLPLRVVIRNRFNKWVDIETVTKNKQTIATTTRKRKTRKKGRRK